MSADDLARAIAALDAERASRKELEVKLAKLSESSMTEQEKAVAAARAEGKAEAEKATALVLAAAEFRLAAKDRIANIDAAVGMLDLTKLLGDDGKPDKKRIAALVDQLAVTPAPSGKVPPGARQPAQNGDTDWIRQIAPRRGHVGR